MQKSLHEASRRDRRQTRSVVGMAAADEVGRNLVLELSMPPARTAIPRMDCVSKGAAETGVRANNRSSADTSQSILRVPGGMFLHADKTGTSGARGAGRPPIDIPGPHQSSINRTAHPVCFRRLFGGFRGAREGGALWSPGRIPRMAALFRVLGGYLTRLDWKPGGRAESGVNCSHIQPPLLRALSGWPPRPHPAPAGTGMNGGLFGGRGAGRVTPYHLRIVPMPLPGLPGCGRHGQRTGADHGPHSSAPNPSSSGQGDRTDSGLRTLSRACGEASMPIAVPSPTVVEVLGYPVLREPLTRHQHRSVTSPQNFGNE